MTESLLKLLAPYLHLSLSAFDNTKLVVAVINSALEIGDVDTLPASAYEASLISASQSTAERYYLVKWQEEWVVCGKTNSYAANIGALEEGLSVDIDSLRGLTIPVMSMQQVSFMCMENAHFDHC